MPLLPVAREVHSQTPIASFKIPLLYDIPAVRYIPFSVQMLSDHLD